MTTQLIKILSKIYTSENAERILRGFVTHNLPIFVEQNIEKGAEDTQYIEVLDSERYSKLSGFYNEMQDKPHKKLVVNYASIGAFRNSYGILDLN
jgi:hypothetical protein